LTLIDLAGQQQRWLVALALDVIQVLLQLAVPD
jgi:hypothetical protein